MSKKLPPGVLSISTPKLAHCAMGFAVDLSHMTKQQIRYIGILVLSGWDNIS